MIGSQGCPNINVTASGAVFVSGSQSDAVLKNGTTSFPQYGIPLPYGDYYLFEAIRYWDNLP